MNLIEELQWRGMLQDIMPDTEKMLDSGMVKGYVGFDPTADSLHVGSMIPIILLKHLQRHGHQPYALVGGATGMVGDPSGKSQERNLLDEETLRANVAGIESQLQKYLDFSPDTNNRAILVNNYDWFRDMSFLDFIRDVGKHITVNYMMAKDSVKKRLETGMSFTEFSYQLVQGYDFYYLYTQMGVTLQMGGSDQWGNIVTGTELIRRKAAGEAFALTCPLMTKSDGSKFGKSESGNIWLDPQKTSPYKFYQFWLNTSDDDVLKYLKIFTFLEPETIDQLAAQHEAQPNLRIMQKTLAEEVTRFIHSQSDLEYAQQASQILFSNDTQQMLSSLTRSQLEEIMEGVPQGDISKSQLSSGIAIPDFLVEAGIVSSKGEAKRAIQAGSIMINKNKITDMDYIVNTDVIIADVYILVQNGKKKYFLVKSN